MAKFLFLLLFFGAISVNAQQEDTTPPVIHEIKIEGPLKAGTKGELLIRATDDISGIKDFSGSCKSLVSESGDSKINICGFVKDLGNDWYSMEIDVGSYVVAEKYTLSRFDYFYDNAGNSADGAIKPVTVQIVK